VKELRLVVGSSSRFIDIEYKLPYIRLAINLIPLGSKFCADVCKMPTTSSGFYLKNVFYKIITTA